MRAMTEAGLEKYLARECKKHEIANYKFSSPSRRGVPDQILIYKCRVIFVELKSPAKTGALSQLQIYELVNLEMQGAEIYVIDEYEQVDELINHIGSHTRPASGDRQDLRLRPYVFNRKDGRGQDCVHADSVQGATGRKGTLSLVGDRTPKSL